MSKKKTNHTHAPADNSGKCPKCGRRIVAGRKPSTPLSADVKLDRAASSAVKALTQIKAEQGARAAKSAAARVAAAITGAGGAQ
jgi:hypothetical protein